MLNAVGPINLFPVIGFSHDVGGTRDEFGFKCRSRFVFDFCTFIDESIAGIKADSKDSV